MNFNNKLTKVLSVLILFMMSFLVGCDEFTSSTDNTNSTDTTTSKSTTNNPSDDSTKDSSLEVHFIDVGQGDSILVKQNGSSMLIDAGDNAYGSRVVDYLKSQGITKLDYVIGTHPHADHIGGLDDVIKTFEVGKVIMPKVTHNTRTFEEVVKAIKDKGLKITTPVVGESFVIGEGEFTILAPNKSKYEDMNDYSVVTRLVYKDNSFLFTGDAEGTSESEILASGNDISADVLKVGHHGSNTSTTDAFLNKVDPRYAVIQVGNENKYGHPTKKTLTKLEKKGIEVYRNDLNGNVVAVSDGKTIKFNTAPVEESTKGSSIHSKKEAYREEPKSEISKNSSLSSSNKGSSVAKAYGSTPDTEVENNQLVDSLNSQGEEDHKEKYIGNLNSHIFHKSSCNSLPSEENRTYFDSREESLRLGYRECKKCNP